MPRALCHTPLPAGLRPLLAVLFTAAIVGCASRPPEPSAGAWQHGAGTEVALTALHYLDTHYRLGGNGADQGFDCSGFTRHVYGRVLGLSLPRRAVDQAHQPGWHRLSQADLQSGDLVFFNTLGSAYSHVGIYVGDGRFVHAPRTGAQVRVENLRTRYWAERFDGGRRTGAMALPAAQAPT